jgi:hypothetical protein
LAKKVLKKQRFMMTEEHYIAQSYVFAVGYKIYPVVYPNGYKIAVQLGENIKIGDKTFSPNRDEWSEQIWDLYMQIYKKDKQKGLV